MNRISKTLLTLALGALVGVASAADVNEHPHGQKVDVKELSPAVAAALAKQGEIKEVHQLDRGGKIAYRAEIKKASGETAMVWVDDKGEVIKDAPKAAENAAKAADKAADKAEKAADKAEKEAGKAGNGGK